MAMESGRGTSRSGFLKQAAGATMVVAGAGVGAGAIAQSAAAASSIGRVSLEIDGVNCGALARADGGGRAHTVVWDSVGSDHIQRKHVGQPKYEDFTFQVGSGMGQPMYDWIKASFDQGYVRKSGALIAADFNYNEKARRSFSDALITEVTIPALDIRPPLAVGDSCYIIMTCPALTVADVTPSGLPEQAAKQKAWLCSNFVLEIDGVDTSRVTKIDSFTWKNSTAADGSSVLEVSDIGVTFPRASLPSWKRWYDSLGSGADDERNGTLTLVGAQGGAVVTIGLGRLGINELLPDAPFGTTSGRVKVEMYCEEVQFEYKASWA